MRHVMWQRSKYIESIHMYITNMSFVCGTEAIKEFENPLEPPSLLSFSRQNISS